MSLLGKHTFIWTITITDRFPGTFAASNISALGSPGTSLDILLLESTNSPEIHLLFPSSAPHPLLLMTKASLMAMLDDSGPMLHTTTNHFIEPCLSSIQHLPTFDEPIMLRRGFSSRRNSITNVISASNTTSYGMLNTILFFWGSGTNLNIEPLFDRFLTTSSASKCDETQQNLVNRRCELSTDDPQNYRYYEAIGFPDLGY
ncbi:h+ nucleoside cotransporter [Moniliophthora roreri]|nr:h+ nucleoside cotransporter [Moniliophthora roreri]